MEEKSVRQCKWTRCVLLSERTIISLKWINSPFGWNFIDIIRNTGGALHYVYMIWFIIHAQTIRNKMLYSIKWKAEGKKNRTNEMQGKSCNWSCKFGILIWILLRILCLDMWFFVDIDCDSIFVRWLVGWSADWLAGDYVWCLWNKILAPQCEYHGWNSMYAFHRTPFMCCIYLIGFWN